MQMQIRNHAVENLYQCRNSVTSILYDVLFDTDDRFNHR